MAKPSIDARVYLMNHGSVYKSLSKLFAALLLLALVAACSDNRADNASTTKQSSERKSTNSVSSKTPAKSAELNNRNGEVPNGEGAFPILDSDRIGKNAIPGDSRSQVTSNQVESAEATTGNNSSAPENTPADDADAQPDHASTPVYVSSPRRTGTTTTAVTGDAANKDSNNQTTQIPKTSTDNTHAEKSEPEITASVADWEAGLLVKSGVVKNSLSFGEKSDATSGFDGRYDVPAFLAGDLQASFIINDGEKLWRDLRAGTAAAQSWELQVSAAANLDEVVISWDSSRLPTAKKCFLVDRASGVSTDMRAQPSYAFMNNQDQNEFVIECRR